MNDEELEARLAALRPADLPTQLKARLSEEPVQPGKILRWAWIAAPLAAAAVWMVNLGIHESAPVSEPSIAAVQPSDLRVYLPVLQESQLLSVEDVAVVDADPGEAIRFVCATWLDDITYAGDDGKTTLRQQVARAEIIPIALESF